MLVWALLQAVLHSSFETSVCKSSFHPFSLWSECSTLRNLQVINLWNQTLLEPILLRYFHNQIYLRHWREMVIRAYQMPSWHLMIVSDASLLKWIIFSTLLTLPPCYKSILFFLNEKCQNLLYLLCQDLIQYMNWISLGNPGKPNPWFVIQAPALSFYWIVLDLRSVQNEPDCWIFCLDIIKETILQPPRRRKGK